MSCTYCQPDNSVDVNLDDLSEGLFFFSTVKLLFPPFSFILSSWKEVTMYCPHSRTAEFLTYIIFYFCAAWRTFIILCKIYAGNEFLQFLFVHEIYFSFSFERQFYWTKNSRSVIFFLQYFKDHNILLSSCLHALKCKVCDKHRSWCILSIYI